MNTDIGDKGNSGPGPTFDIRSTNHADNTPSRFNDERGTIRTQTGFRNSKGVEVYLRADKEAENHTVICVKREE